MRYPRVKESVESSLENYWGEIKELVQQYFSKPRPVEQDVYCAQGHGRESVVRGLYPIQGPRRALFWDR